MSILEIKKLINAFVDEGKELSGQISNSLVSDSLLMIRKRSNSFYYFERLGSEDRGGIYLGKDKVEEIRHLENLEYYRLLKAAADSNKAICDEVLSLLDRVVELEEVYYQIPQERRHLIRQYTYEVDQKYFKHWASQKWKRKQESEHFLVTSKGEKVRSKSELIIAERLSANGVPYHYEYPVRIRGYGFWYPDFLVINKRTRQEYFWEHFGKMDDLEYCLNAQGRLEEFAKNGIVLGKNLIVSMETTNRPLNTEYVNKIIEELLT